jgi:hypothetical protein
VSPGWVRRTSSPMLRLSRTSLRGAAAISSTIAAGALWQNHYGSSEAAAQKLESRRDQQLPDASSLDKLRFPRET